MRPDEDRQIAPTDHTGLRVLTFDECLRRIGQSPVGRIAFLQEGEIAVLPVNHILQGLNVYFRTQGGSKIEAAINGERVAFEVDSFDETARQGWSILVHGIAEVVTEPDDLRRLEPFSHLPWVPIAPGQLTWVRVRSTAVTGRALAGA